MAGFKFHVFLSHNSVDKPAVEELAVRLKREGIEPWLDKWNLVPGDAWQPAIERALGDCASCAVVIGSGGFSVWQNEEMRAAIDRRVAECQGQFRVIPILLPGVDRPERGKLPSFLIATTWVEFRNSLDDEVAFHRLICGIQGREPGAGPGGAAFEGACPYRGLEVFDVEHAPFFFGREALTEWLVNEFRPAVTGQENRFLAILGASGSGKSSLARAGLVASLKKGALGGSGDWPIVILKPGHNPLESLSVALAGLPGGASLVKDTRDLLNIKTFGDDPKSLHTLARLALRDALPSRRLFVLVDQMEEVFTLCDHEPTRQAFIGNLLYAATVPEGQTKVVLTMRADFYGKCGLYAELAATMSAHQRLVGPMTEHELRSAVERPAHLAGGEFESGLVEILLQDVLGQPGSLPLLQFTLMELWQHREGRRLTVATYKAIGGLQGALTNRADNVLAQFDDAQRDLCRRVFMRLTQPGEGSEDTKRRASLGELVPAGANPLAVEAVVRRLADARLITTEGDSQVSEEVSVEVAHEALIRGWAQLRSWVEEDRAGLRIHRQLTDAARAWQAHGRDNSFLFRGSLLRNALDWAKARRHELNDRENEFLKASLRKRQRGKVAVMAPILLVALASIGGWGWLQSVNRNRLLKSTYDVQEHLKNARKLDGESRWGEAIEHLVEASKLLEPGVGDESLQRQVKESLDEYKKKDDDRKFAALLDKARLLGNRTKEGLAVTKATMTKYSETFRDFGIDIEALVPERAAELIRTKHSGISAVLAATLDDWARSAVPPIYARLREIARKADPDPWRDKIRDKETQIDKSDLTKLAADRDFDKQPAATLLRLGDALLETTDGREAGIAVLQRAQHLHPDDFWINQTLAVAFSLYEPPQYGEVIRYLTLAVAIRPDSAEEKSYLGSILGEIGQLGEAKDYCDEAVLLDPTSALVFCDRGVVYLARKEYDKAIADLEKAIGIEPTFTRAHNARGYAYCRRGVEYASQREYDKAIADMDRAIELTPTSAEAHNNRAWFRATCPDGKYRNGKQAVASATRACELTAWNNPVFLDTLGAACAEHRDFTAAVEWQEKALALLGASQHPIQKEIESRLTLFQAKQPYHERTNAPRTNDPSAQPARP